MRDDARRVTLFVTGQSPRSRRARTNLAAVLKAANINERTIQEIDLLQEPEFAVKFGVYATPALMLETRESGPSVLYGDLSEADKLQRFVAAWLAAP